MFNNQVIRKAAALLSGVAVLVSVCRMRFGFRFQLQCIGAGQAGRQNRVRH